MNPVIQKRLEGRRIQVFRAFEKALKGKKSARLSFTDIAREVGCDRKTVTYHYRVLLAEGLIGVKDGKMFLIRHRRKRKL